MLLSLDSWQGILLKLKSVLLKSLSLLIKPNLISFYVLTFCFYAGQANRFQSHQADAAGYVDTLAASNDYKLNFAYGFSGKRAIELFQMAPLQGCSEGFSNPYADISFFRVHPYLISFFSRFLDPNFQSIATWPLLLLSLSYAAGMVSLFSLVKRETNLKIAISFFLFILCSSPLFFESLRGQPYIDRLAFGPIIMILVRIYEKRYLRKSDLVITLFLCLLTGTFSERAALILGALLLFAPIIFNGLETIRESKTWALFAAGLALFTYYWVWNQIYSSGEYTGNTAIQNFLPNLSRLLSGDRNLNFQIFLSVIASFILISLFRIRFFVLVLLVVLPNLLADVGGAELSGFSTHYLGFILPVVAVTSGLGLIELYRYLNLKNSKRALSKTLLVSLVLGMLSSNLYLSHIDAGAPYFSKVELMIGKQLDAFGLSDKRIQKGREYRHEMALEFTKGIASDSVNTITSPEPFLPTLMIQGHRTLEIFPVGIGLNKYLIVPFLTEDFLEVEYTFNGTISLENQKIWSSCIKKILENNYIELKKSPTQIGNYVLYKKIS